MAKQEFGDFYLILFLISEEFDFATFVARCKLDRRLKPCKQLVVPKAIAAKISNKKTSYRRGFRSLEKEFLL